MLIPIFLLHGSNMSYIYKLITILYIQLISAIITPNHEIKWIFHYFSRLALRLLGSVHDLATLQPQT